MIDFKKCGQPASSPEVHHCQEASLKKIVAIYFFHITLRWEAVQCSKWFYSQQSSLEYPDSAEDKSKKNCQMNCKWK